MSQTGLFPGTRLATGTDSLCSYKNSTNCVGKLGTFLIPNQAPATIIKTVDLLFMERMKRMARNVVQGPKGCPQDAD